MERDTTRPGSDDPIEACRRLLGRREFSLCRIQAHMARESNPNSSDLTQILAITDVLLAAESRIADGRLDFYSILQVTQSECETKTLILNQFKKLVMILCPSKNRFPFSNEAFNFICQAWSVLSKPEKKKIYDNEISNASMAGKPKTHKANAAAAADDDGDEGGNEEKQKIETFWTICPYCCYLYEYGKIYKELCLRCQNCRRAFHGMEVGPLSANLTADGVDKYLCQIGCFKIRYPFHGFFSLKESNVSRSVDGTNTGVEVSDGNDDGGNDNDDGGNDDGGMRSKVTEQETVNKERRLNGKRVKSTAWNTRKGMEMRMRMLMKKRKISEPS